MSARRVAILPAVVLLTLVGAGCSRRSSDTREVELLAQSEGVPSYEGSWFSEGGVEALRIASKPSSRMTIFGARGLVVSSASIDTQGLTMRVGFEWDPKAEPLEMRYRRVGPDRLRLEFAGRPLHPGVAGDLVLNPSEHWLMERRRSRIARTAKALHERGMDWLVTHF